MLKAISGWQDALNALEDIKDGPTAEKNFAQAIGNLMNDMQLVGGKAGVFTYDYNTMASALSGLMNASSAAWSTIMSSAWGAGIATSQVMPATVTNPAWTGSTKDTQTVPVGASTIPNASAAVSSLQSSLAAIDTSSDMLNIAKCFRDATLTLQFIAIGTDSNGAPIPVTLGIQ